MRAILSRLAIRSSKFSTRPFARERLRTLTEALGWLYVAELTRNGHQLLRHYLTTKLARLSPGEYVSRVTKCQWTELSAALDGVDSQAELDHAVVDAFEAQHRWFRPSSPSATTLVVALHHARTALRVR